MRTPTRPRSTGWTDPANRSPSQTGTFGLRALGAIVAVIACLAALAACSSNQSKSNGGGHSPPANVAPAVARSSANPPVQDPTGLLYKINPAFTKQNVTFFPDPSPPMLVSSHAQGIARYRGPGPNPAYDYYIISYSNLAGRFGYVYIASNNPKGLSEPAFTLQVPAVPIQLRQVRKGDKLNPHFNHPGGIQVIGDYLVVPVLPYHTRNAAHFYDAAIIYLYDLTPLKGSKPTKPTRERKILELQKTNGGSLNGVGITRLPDGHFALGVVAQRNLDIYISSNKPADLWDAQWNTKQPDYIYTLGPKYQTNGLFLDTAGQVWMAGFDDATSEADLYQLTYNGNWAASGIRHPQANRRLTMSGGVSFRWGGGIETRGPSAIWLYAHGKDVKNYDRRYYKRGDPSRFITINYWGLG